MICLFRDGILSGLQFEIENPPYRIRSEFLKPLPISLKVEEQMGIMAPYKRGSEVYVATTVNVKTETQLDGELQGQITVYELERSW